MFKTKHFSLYVSFVNRNWNLNCKIITKLTWERSAVHSRHYQEKRSIVCKFFFLQLPPLTFVRNRNKVLFRVQWRKSFTEIITIFYLIQKRKYCQWFALILLYNFNKVKSFESTIWINEKPNFHTTSRRQKYSWGLWKYSFNVFCNSWNSPLYLKALFEWVT